MPVQLNHTFGPFLTVECANGVTLDVADDHAEVIAPQHYAFVVTETEFDEVRPERPQPGNHHSAVRQRFVSIAASLG